jgi:excisionase family DNA binding protein
VADYLNVSTHALYRLVRERKIPAVSLGRYYRFDPRAIEHFVAAGGRGLDE